MKPLDINELLHKLFVVGVGAAAIFVKNPASQQKAATIISILESLLPHAEASTGTTGIVKAMSETTPIVDDPGNGDQETTPIVDHQ